MVACRASIKIAVGWNDRLTEAVYGPRHWRGRNFSGRIIETTMTIKRVTIAQHERALVWKNKTFAGVLEPGKHWLIAPISDVQALAL